MESEHNYFHEFHSILLVLKNTSSKSAVVFNGYEGIYVVQI